VIKAFMLKRDELGDYSILTGYELAGRVVEPLDGKRNLPKHEPDTQFGIYRAPIWRRFAMHYRRLYSKQTEG